MSRLHKFIFGVYVNEELMDDILQQIKDADSGLDAAHRELYREGYERELRRVRDEWTDRLKTHKNTYRASIKESWRAEHCAAAMEEFLSVINSDLQESKDEPKPSDPLKKPRSEITQSVIEAWVRLQSFTKEERDHHQVLLDTSVMYRRIVGAHRKGMHLDPWDRDCPEEQKTRQSRAIDAGPRLLKRSPKKVKTKPAKKPLKEPAKKPKPPARLIRSPRDAELVALDWMLYWGFDDASATPVGPDEGIDVASSRAVAQVKAFMVPIGRPELQNLAGVAAVEKKIPLFFALNGYTPQAVEWGNKAKMALFTFDLQGNPEPVNDEARKYFA
jgi:hypothetical protein